jgi:imidazolonepropionase-like amidohydrolase
VLITPSAWGSQLTGYNHHHQLHASHQGANHLVEGETTDSLATRVKVRLSEDEWRTINTAMEHGTPIPANSSQNMLLGYHYALRQQAKLLAKEMIEI